MELTVGINAGATNILLGVFEPGNPWPLSTCRIDTKRRFEVDIPAIARAVSALAGAVGPNGCVTQVGIVAAGKVAEDCLSLVGAGQLAGWVGQPLVKDLQTLTGLPVVLGNDAQGEAAANALYLPAVLDVDFVYLGVGTGIGGCRIYRDVELIVFPAEIGHTPLLRATRSRRRCSCGGWDCLELYAGGDGIKVRFGVESPDQLSDDHWTLVADDLGFGVHGLLMAHAEVSTVVLGGGVVDKQPHLIGRLRAYLAANVRVTGASYVVYPSIFLGENPMHPSLAGAVLLDSAI